MSENVSLRPAEWLADLDRQYRPSLLAFFRRRSGNPGEAEDMVQEVFARMYATPGIERQTASAYIFRAAANLVNDRARREAVRAAYHQTSPDARIELVENRDPERIIAGRQAWAGIRRVLETLPERTRVIFVLFRLEGMARKDIASHFGISVSAVEKHIANAMQALMRAREEWS